MEIIIKRNDGNNNKFDIKTYNLNNIDSLCSIYYKFCY
jgi:hypothetical protein